MPLPPGFELEEESARMPPGDINAFIGGRAGRAPAAIPEAPPPKNYDYLIEYAESLRKAGKSEEEIIADLNAQAGGLPEPFNPPGTAAAAAVSGTIYGGPLTGALTGLTTLASEYAIGVPSSIIQRNYPKTAALLSIGGGLALAPLEGALIKSIAKTVKKAPAAARKFLVKQGLAKIRKGDFSDPYVRKALGIIEAGEIITPNVVRKLKQKSAKELQKIAAKTQKGFERHEAKRLSEDMSRRKAYPIEKQLSRLERFRQSPKSGELLRKQLKQTEAQDLLKKLKAKRLHQKLIEDVIEEPKRILKVEQTIADAPYKKIRKFKDALTAKGFERSAEQKLILREFKRANLEDISPDDIRKTLDTPSFKRTADQVRIAKRFYEMEIKTDLGGFLLGVEIDEEGNVSVDPEKAAIGLFLGIFGRKAGGRLKINNRNPKIRKLMAKWPHGIATQASGRTVNKTITEIQRAVKHKGNPIINPETAEKASRAGAEYPVLQKIEKTFSGEIPKRKKFLNPLERIQTAVTTQYTPAAAAEKRILKQAGKPVPKVNIARKFEALAGSRAGAQLEVEELEKTVIKPVINNYHDFTKYLALKRIQDRLSVDPVKRAVGSFTIDETKKGLLELKSKVGAEVFDVFKETGKKYQTVMDKSLRSAVDSGMLSGEAYKTVKEMNDFYAPFKIMKYVDDSIAEGAGRNIATRAQVIKAVKGIKNEDVIIGDIMETSVENLYKTKDLTDRNMVMREFAQLADIDKTGEIMRKASKSEIAKLKKPDVGMDILYYRDNGELQGLIVDKTIADSLTGFNKPQAGLAGKILRAGSITLKTGATVFNANFQLANVIAADIPEVALFSKMGVSPVNPFDAVRFGLWDVPYAFFTSFTKGRLVGGELMRDFLKSGMANSTIQRGLTPSAFESRGITPFRALPLGGKAKRAAYTLIDTLPKITNAFEEGSKLLALKRGKRLAAKGKMTPLELRTEVRLYGGSPDFPKKGSLDKHGVYSLLYMFYNPRVQGAARDIARLTGVAGRKEALKVWGRAATLLGVPTVALAVYNNLPENRKDYLRVSERERRDNFMFPKPSYFVNERGEIVRDYWKYPRREGLRMLSTLIESAVEFAYSKDKREFYNYAEDFLENIVPFNIQGENMLERGESFLSGFNPAIQAPIGTILDRNFYLHRDTDPLYIKGIKSEKLSPQYVTRKTTPDIYNKISLFMAEKTGGSVSAPRLEQFVNSVTGNFAAQLSPWMIKKEDRIGREYEYRIPMWRKFIRSPYLARNNDYKKTERELADESFLMRTQAEKIMTGGEDIDSYKEKIKKHNLKTALKILALMQNGGIKIRNKSDLKRAERLYNTYSITSEKVKNIFKKKLETKPSTLPPGFELEEANK